MSTSDGSKHTSGQQQDTVAQKAWNFIREVAHGSKDELGRMGSLGASELASALFSDKAFVLYGPGQRSPHGIDAREHQSGPAQEQERVTDVGPEQAHENDGRSR